MAPKIWLSFLLPIYNVESYLSECLESLLDQIGNDNGVQIVIVDDASTDKSHAIARAFCSQYPHLIKVLPNHSVNEGVSAARNRLIDAADGEHIWFVDPDDYILKDALRQLHTVLETYNPDLILCDYRKSRFAIVRSFYGPSKQLSSDIRQLVCGVFKSRKMYCWLKISRRSLWNDGLRFPESRIFEDIATIPWLLLKAQNYYYVPSPWIFYRQRAGSIMDSVKGKSSVFDASKHQDLAEALSGFKEEKRERLNGIRPSTAYYVSDFCAKECVKTGFRFARWAQVTDGSHAVGLDHYLKQFEACAPMHFQQLAFQYLKRLRFLRYVLLKYTVHLANRLPNSTARDNGNA